MTDDLEQAQRKLKAMRLQQATLTRTWTERVAQANSDAQEFRRKLDRIVEACDLFIKAHEEEISILRAFTDPAAHGRVVIDGVELLNLPADFWTLYTEKPSTYSREDYVTRLSEAEQEDGYILAKAVRTIAADDSQPRNIPVLLPKDTPPP